MIDIGVVNIQGGSLRILCKKDFNKKINQKLTISAKEKKTNLYNKVL